MSSPSDSSGSRRNQGPSEKSQQQSRPKSNSPPVSKDPKTNPKTPPKNAPAVDNGHNAPREASSPSAGKNPSSPRSSGPQGTATSSPSPVTPKNRGAQSARNGRSPTEAENVSASSVSQSHSAPGSEIRGGKHSPRSNVNTAGWDDSCTELPSPSRLTRPNQEASPRASNAKQKVTAGHGSMVFARQLKQTMRGNTTLYCYRFDVAAKGGYKPALNGYEHSILDPEYDHNTIDRFFNKVLIGSQRILTDYTTCSISTSMLGPGVVIGSALAPDTMGLIATATIKWSEVLEFLDTGRFPVEDDRTNDVLFADVPNLEKKMKNRKLAVMDTLKALIAMKFGSEDDTKIEGRFKGEDVKENGKFKSKPKTFTILDLHSKTTKTEERLDEVISQMLSESIDPRGMEACLKGRSVKISADPGTNSQSNQKRPRKIVGLAHHEDASGSTVSNPPIVEKNAGNSHDVKFFLSQIPKLMKERTKYPAKYKSRYVSIAEYYNKFKSQQVRRPDLPVLNVGTRRKPTYIPPEFCTFENAGKDITISKMNGETLQDLIRAVAQLADPNNILQGIGIMHKNQSANIKVPPGLARSIRDINITAASGFFPYRAIQSPRVAYADAKRPEMLPGSWKPKQLTLTKEKTLKIALLRVGSSPWATGEKKLENSEKLLKRLGDHGIRAEDFIERESPMPALKFDQNVQKGIKEQLDMFLKSGHRKVLVVIPDRKQKQQKLYDYIKQVCDIEIGLHSICVLDSVLVEDSFYHLALKLNMKTGGQNQRLERVPLKSTSLKQTMLVGFEVISPARDAPVGSRSIAALVGSTDENLSLWPASVKVLDTRPAHEELADLLTGRLTTWEKKYSEYPENIVIYYNGLNVEDKERYQGEVAFIKKACESFIKVKSKKEVSQAHSPRLTLIAVNKDQHAELRALGSFNKGLTEKSQKEETIPNGSILVQTGDEDRKGTWEFVLQGHLPFKNDEETQLLRKQTKKDNSTELYVRATTPVRYHVLYDEVFRDSNAKVEFENLTHDMCYLSGCSTNSVTDTLPIHYVGLLCQRIQSYVRIWNRSSVEDEPAEDMKAKTIQAT